MSTKRNSVSLWPILLMVAGVLLIGGALIWYLNPFGSSPAEITVASIAEDTYPNVPRVSLADAKAAYDTGTAVFLDVRDAGSYADSHIKGAINIPLAILPNRINELNPADWIITYCT
jgi:3-mercaptopyruvate sulfurtransferase SseA